MRRAFGAGAVGVATVIAATLLSGCAASVVGHGQAAAPRSSASPRSSVATTRAPSVTPTTQHPSVAPAPDACAANRAAQRVIVDVSAQRAWLCAGAHTVFQTPVTTGAVDLPYDSTPLGTYQVQARARNVTLTLVNGDTYQVRYWIPFDAPLYGFHDAPWQNFPFGGPQYRTRGSHGCVHLPTAAMARLYSWVTVGTAVTVRA